MTSQWPVVEISHVEVDSPAYDAGFEPGCKIAHVDGHPIRDIIDWRWATSEDEIELGYIDLDGEEGEIVLVRDSGEDWGLTFDGAVFDGVRICRNSCLFCFMRQLPKGMRPSLSMRDDDFRLSFLEGTFCTFTNMNDEQIERIIEQKISPLRASVHAISPDIRERLIGRRAQEGINAIERLMSGGIHLDIQLVLCPGINDGEELDRTLDWAMSKPLIDNVGIVPLGFTCHQNIFQESFDDPEASLRILDQVRPFQERAIKDRGSAFIYPSDEFYCNAYGEEVLEHLPEASFYGDFSMFEDGIGIVRSAVDSWGDARRQGVISRLAECLRRSETKVYYLCGQAMSGYANLLAKRGEIDDVFEFKAVENEFFGGNVNVTGLLCGCDIANAANAIAVNASGSFGKGMRSILIAVPEIVLNDDGVTLDDWTFDDIISGIDDRTIASCHLVGANPLNYCEQLANIVCND